MKCNCLPRCKKCQQGPCDCACESIPALAPPSGEGADSKLIEWAQQINDAAKTIVTDGLATLASDGRPLHEAKATIVGASALILERLTTPQSASVDSKEPSMITATPGSVFDDRPVNTEHPLFERIWQTIKQWDIQRAPGAGYAGATGTDVQIIIDAIATPPPASQERGVALAWRPMLQWAIGTIDELNNGPMTADQWAEDAGLYQLARSLAFDASPPSSAAEGDKRLSVAVDAAFPSAEQAKPDEVKYTECTRDCDCVGYCKAGLEKPVAEQAKPDGDIFAGIRSNPAFTLDGLNKAFAEYEQAQAGELPPLEALAARWSKQAQDCECDAIRLEGQPVANELMRDAAQYRQCAYQLRATVSRLAGGVTVDVKSLLSLKLHRSMSLNRWCWFYPNGQAFNGNMYGTPQDAVEARDAALVAALGAK